MPTNGTSGRAALNHVRFRGLWGLVSGCAREIKDWVGFVCFPENRIGKHMGSSARGIRLVARRWWLAASRRPGAHHLL